MKGRPLPGDVVRLNDRGMRSVCGLKSSEEIRQAQRMVITGVWHDHTPGHAPTYPIQVDQPLINRFLITQLDVDLIERPATPLPNRLPPRAMTLNEAVARGHAEVEMHDGVRHIIIGGRR